LLGAGLTRVFPSAEQVTAADLAQLGMPRARREALRALARAALEDPRLFEPAATIEQTVARLRRIHGIGDWTAHYIALRAAREPDAFPAGDRGLVRGLSLCDGDSQLADCKALTLRAESWRPWRSYAAQQLWALDAAARAGAPAFRAGGAR
jgi:AraC family transcriptional regulator of adaptative response / DNA-3-methyladenine glycosylase II